MPATVHGRRPTLRTVTHTDGTHPVTTSTTPPDLTSLPRSALLDTATAAAALGLAPETLANWRVTGRYALAYVRCGRYPRYRVGDLLDWLDRRTQQHTGQSARCARSASAA